MQPDLKLNNGHQIPALGLGTYQAELNEAGELVKLAIDVGYRHFDCAHFYGNEKEIGEAIRSKIADGTIKREDIFVTSKLWNTYHSKSSVLGACKTTLANFGLEYLDLYLIHWPLGWKEGDDLWPLDSQNKIQTSDVDYLETWTAMEKLVESKLVRSIGLSNFNSEQINRVLSVAKIKPVVNQVECNPNINQKKLISFCRQKDIVVTGYCPLGQISSLGRPGFPTPSILDPKIIEISKKHGKTPAQIVLKYLVDLGISVIPKTSKKERLQENLNIFDVRLHREDTAYIDSLNTGNRVCKLEEWRDHQYYPFDIEY